MKNNILKLVLGAVMQITAIAGYAYDFKLNGIYYTITSSSEHTCMVTWGTSMENSYSGEVKIPASATYNAIEYKVTAIDSYAFFKCTDLYYVEIPSSVNTMNRFAFCGCPSLSLLINLSTTPQTIATNTFNSSTPQIHVPNGYENDYKSSANWNSLNITGDLIYYTLGDADNNGIVNAEDVKFLDNYLISKRTKLYNTYASDVNSDDKVDILDIVYLISMLNGKYNPTNTNTDANPGGSVIPSWGRPNEDPSTPEEGETEF